MDIQVGKGVSVKVNGNIVTLTFDASKNHGPSSTGKTTTVATTGGNVMLPNGVYVGLNAYRKP